MRDPDEYEADALRCLQKAKEAVGQEEYDGWMREAQVWATLAHGAAVDWARVRS